MLAIQQKSMFCQLNTRYALVARALVRTRFLSRPPCHIDVDIRGVYTTQMANGFDLCNGTIFRIRWKIDVPIFNSHFSLVILIEHQSFTSCEISYALQWSTISLFVYHVRHDHEIKYGHQLFHGTSALRVRSQSFTIHKVTYMCVAQMYRVCGTVKSEPRLTHVELESTLGARDW